MEIEEFKEELKKHLSILNIEIEEEQIKQFYQYMNMLIDWNKKINLTAIVEPKEIILKHFIDSLTISRYVNKNSTIIDVGTGAGFPGIPLKIIRQDIEVTLVDSLNKRVKFLNEVIEKLNLDNIKAIHGRAEEIGRNIEYREKYDYATSRAVANTATLSEYLIPLIKLNGECIYMKGLDVDEEVKKGKRAINVLGGKIIKNDEFKLTYSDIKRTVIIVKKIKKTPEKYPRKAGMPSKEPII
jgi:16S rRNA (guanine527-N7)-methyltransferase